MLIYIRRLNSPYFSAYYFFFHNDSIAMHSDGAVKKQLVMETGCKGQHTENGKVRITFESSNYIKYWHVPPYFRVTTREIVNSSVQKWIPGRIS